MTSNSVSETPVNISLGVEKEKVEVERQSPRATEKKEEEKKDELSTKTPTMDPKVRQDTEIFLQELNALVDVRSIEPSSEGDLLELFCKHFNCIPGTQEWVDSMKALLGRAIGPYDPRYSEEEP
ncbi:hypothetical protein I302_101099 [Kwoniella bestiolae CBS 10118]|uniref:Uncharacterized protein n=1 Tax=Kwoniella bestiolae CBS 10118 TaxID=1296100 RepID=A0A1B9G6Y2_9TREE|nr:hypothetical protein I302_04474 [Kwoniella bestiolae CBS 10118]OCF26785.1 hypothetical protein I302_04474 [Kwoniella bestiolae CBS 10118]